MKKMRKYLAFLWITALLFGALPVFAAEEPLAVIYYTNDIHGAYESMGKVAALADQDNSILVDAGDAAQGSIATTLTDGQAMIDVMKAMNYDVVIPGNHEFDYGVSRFMEMDREMDYICLNFMELGEEQSLLEPYKIVDVDGNPATEDDQIAFIGMLTPLTITSTRPIYFQDEDGNWIYSFLTDGTGEDLFRTVQNAIDDAKAEGADYVIGVGHLGNEGDPYQSENVIKNTAGLNAMIDAHSHVVMEEEWVKDKNGKEVLLTQTGTKLEYVGCLELFRDGTVSSQLIEVETLTEVDPEVQMAVDAVTTQIEDVSEDVIGKTEVILAANDPVTGLRLVRHRETNLGNLAADMYKDMLKTDIGLVNGGGIRDDIQLGEITKGDLIAIHPFGNTLCSVEATGQQILDALEVGVMNYPAENGSFLHVSGLTFELHSYIPSSVVLDAAGALIEVNGEYRVKNVKIGGEPLDLTEKYTVGGHNYVLLSGAYSMFDDAVLIQDDGTLDCDALIRYLVEEKGGIITAESEYADPYGEGRIIVVDQPPVDPQTVVTRAMAVQMLYAMEHEGIKVSEAEAVAWVKDAGIAVGYTDGTFGEKDPVSRQQMAMFLYKYAKYKGVDVSVGEDTNILSYDDFMKISEYAFPALQWACGAGVMNGRTDGTLDPRGTIIYSEAQWMIRNYEGK